MPKSKQYGPGKAAFLMGMSNLDRTTWLNEVQTSIDWGEITAQEVFDLLAGYGSTEMAELKERIADLEKEYDELQGKYQELLNSKENE